MNLARRFRKTLLFISKCMLFTLLVAAFASIWWVCYTQTQFYERGNYVVVLTYALVLFVFSRVFGSFNNGMLRLWEIMYSSVMAIFTANALTYLQLCLIASSLLNPLGMVSITLIQALLAILGNSLINKLYFYLYPVRDIALVCPSYREVQPLLKKLRSIRERYRVCAVIETRDRTLEEICRTLSPFPSVLICDMEHPLKEGVLTFCYGQNMRTYILPTVSDIVTNHAHHTQIFDTPVLLCKNRGPTAEQLLIKRGVDILLSLVMLIVASPVMLVTAIAIRLYDKGPALLRQQRLTLHGRVFTVYKFRSMVLDAEGDGVARLATQHDDRITPIGRFIRKVRIDELPQLFNILMGDMSMVGPRPERPEIAEIYEEALPEFPFRLKAKAGLTGYAQVYGKYNTTPRDKLSMDLFYIENYSLIMDLKLILMTVKILFTKESTEGVEDDCRLPQ